VSLNPCARGLVTFVIAAVLSPWGVLDAGASQCLPATIERAPMRAKIENLTKRFGATLVLDQINLEIRERESPGLLRPSGSVETTLLRILAGLEIADDGTVLFGRQDAGSLLLQEPQVGFVFQHCALFLLMRVRRQAPAPAHGPEMLQPFRDHAGTAPAGPSSRSRDRKSPSAPG
jgi:ABC-type branched-subunit amino acid transport system ATPase component